MQIGFASKTLLEDSAFLLLYFYDDPTLTCTGVRTQLDRPRPTIGPVRLDLNAESKANGLRYRNDLIPATTYVVLADALAVDGGLVGTGCAQDQRVLAQQVSQVRITIQPPR